MTLLRQQAKQEWLSLLIWSLALGALFFYVVSLFESLGESMAQLEAIVKAMPESLRAIYGGSLSLRTLPGFLEAYGFGTWVWLPFLIYTALFATTITTREIDRRTMEFLLALPVSRWQLILSRWCGMGLALGILNLVHSLAIAGGVLAIGQDAMTGRYLMAGLNLWLLMLAIGSILMLVDLFLDDYGRAVGANLGISLGLFAFHIATEQAEGGLKALRAALPLARYNPGPIIAAGEAPWGDLAILAAIALAALGLTILLFERKQVAI